MAPGLHNASTEADGGDPALRGRKVAGVSLRSTATSEFSSTGS